MQAWCQGESEGSLLLSDQCKPRSVIVEEARAETKRRPKSYFFLLFPPAFLCVDMSPPRESLGLVNCVTNVLN